MPLQFNLLGSLDIRRDGHPSELLKSPKGCALIAYLIVTQQTHTREFLADLLWETTSTPQALHNLRALLNRFHNLVPELRVTRTTLAFQPFAETSVDLLTLQAALEGNPAQREDAQLDTALQLYRGDLLANFYLERAPRFKEWLVLERERLRQKVQAAYQRLCKNYLKAGQWASALALGQRWLDLDPLNEEAVRACMQILADQGELRAGLQQYETFRQQLWGRFELDPEPATISLAARLKELLEEQGQAMTWGHITAPIFPDPGELPDPGPLPTKSILPYRRNPDFIGREADLLALAKTLLSQERINTPPTAAITGMGGLGKTQLAVEFAYRYGRSFPEGIYWLRFADPNHVPSEIAATGGERGLGLYQEAENLTLTDQVGRVQRAWQEPVPRLLIFDNCESQALLEQWRPVTGGCRILLTSRRAEWSRELNLTCLPLNVLGRSESTRLLQSLAPDLDQDYADEIAADVGDLPLAIHLAGSFLGRYRQISPAAYLTQLRDENLLRHPSLQGRGSGYSPTGHELNVARTYALSWEQLDPADQIDSAARQLLVCAACLAPSEPIPAEWLKSLMRTDDDALTMTLLAEDGLSRLVTLGFLKREAGQTVTLHPLLASFTQETSGEEEFGAVQARVTRSLIRTYSERLQKQGHLSTLPISAFHLRHASQEALTRKTPQATDLTTLLGVHLLNIGETLEAERILGQAYAAGAEIEDIHSQAHTLITLSRVQESLGHFEDALESSQQAVALFKEAEGSDPAGLTEALWQQGRVFHRMEQPEAALSAAREGHALSQTMHLRQAEARFFDLMGVVNYYHLARYELAQGQLEEGLALYRELGNRRSENSILNHMGENARLQGDFALAAHYYEEALDFARDIENQSGINLLISNLCGARIGMGEFKKAAGDLEELIASIHHDWFGLSEAYRFLSEAYLGQGKTAQGFAMAQQALAAAQPSSLLDQGRAWRMLGLAAAALGEPVLSKMEDETLYDAETCFRCSLDLFKPGKADRDRAITLWHWAQYELKQGNEEQGQAMWQEAKDIFTRLNLHLMVARMENRSNAQ